MLPLPSFLRRSVTGMAGREHPSASSLQLFSVVPPAGAPKPVSSPRSPLGELHTAGSLDEFHTLVRRHQVDRIYLDLLDLPAAGRVPDGATCHVILSASKGGVDLLARLPWPNDKGSASPVDPVTYRNVLRSRFLFLGYSVSEGLASARLSRHLQGPSHDDTPKAKTA